jgi:large subunit ribosomal protein L19
MAVKTSPVNMEERRNLGLTPGDTVRVWQKVQEKGKTRLQPFEGIVLSRKHGDQPGATFTVRRVTGNVGVEKIFPLYSPVIDRIEIIRSARVRRSKLYYIRGKVSREIKRHMRNMVNMSASTSSDLEEQQRAQQEAEEAAAAEQGEQQEEAATQEQSDESQAGEASDDTQEGQSEEDAQEQEVEEQEKNS